MSDNLRESLIFNFLAFWLFVALPAAFWLTRRVGRVEPERELSQGLRIVWIICVGTVLLLPAAMLWSELSTPDPLHLTDDLGVLLMTPPAMLAAFLSLWIVERHLAPGRLRIAARLLKWALTVCVPVLLKGVLASDGRAARIRYLASELDPMLRAIEKYRRAHGRLPDDIAPMLPRSTPRGLDVQYCAKGDSFLAGYVIRSMHFGRTVYYDSATGRWDEVENDLLDADGAEKRFPEAYMLYARTGRCSAHRLE